MTDTSMVPRKRDDGSAPLPPLVDEELADQLLGKAQAEGVELLGPDGLLSQVAKAVLESGLGLARGTLKIKVLNERAEFVLQQDAIQWVLRQNLIAEFLEWNKVPAGPGFSPIQSHQ